MDGKDSNFQIEIISGWEGGKWDWGGAHRWIQLYL